METIKEKIYVRASQLRDLYTPSKLLKSGEKSKVGGIKKAKCREILSQINRGYTYNSWTTNAMLKGSQIENESVNFAKIFTGQKDIVYITNEPEDSRLRNVRKGYLRGTADIISNKEIIDIKTAYNWHSFDMTTESDLLEDYERQMRAYMYLYDKDKATIFYVFTQTPGHIIYEEERKLFYKSNGKWINDEDPDYIEACKEMGKIFNIENIGISERVKIVEIDRDIEKEIEMIEYINEAIDYMLTYYNEIQDRKKRFEEKLLKNI